jgi:sodium-dependent dicarboxylate transporter 2/3/5
LGATVFLWLTVPWHGLHEAATALVAAAVLTGLRVLDRRDVDSVDWNILILMWGGLSLGVAMELTGLAAWVGGWPFQALPGWVVPVLFIATALGLSTVMSNTAAAALLIPLSQAVAGSGAAALPLLTAYACSFAMALPVSTPPNAIAFASGAVSSRDMLKAGGLISILGAAFLWAGHRFILPLMFR